MSARGDSGLHGPVCLRGPSGSSQGHNPPPCELVQGWPGLGRAGWSHQKIPCLFLLLVAEGQSWPRLLSDARLTVPITRGARPLVSPGGSCGFTGALGERVTGSGQASEERSGEHSFTPRWALS